MQMQDRRKNAETDKDGVEGAMDDGRLVLLTSFILSVFGDLPREPGKGKYECEFLRHPFPLVVCPSALPRSLPK